MSTDLRSPDRATFIDVDGDTLAVVAHHMEGRGPQLWMSAAQNDSAAELLMSRATVQRIFQFLRDWLTVTGQYARSAPEGCDAEPETITAEAERHVYGSRHDDYGHPREDFTRTAIIWTGLLQHKLADGEHITPEDMARCMIGVKLARDVHQPKRDNRVDGAGYFLTLDRLATGQ